MRNIIPKPKQLARGPRFFVLPLPPTNHQVFHVKSQEKRKHNVTLFLIYCTDAMIIQFAASFVTRILQVIEYVF